MRTDIDTGWTEPDITINGHRLTFPEAMTLRVAVSSFRLFVRGDNRQALGQTLADGYDRHLASIERAMMETV